MVRLRRGRRQGAPRRGPPGEGIDPATWQPKLSFRDAVRGYLPDPPTIAQEIAEPAADQPGHHRHARPAGVGDLPRQQRCRQARRPVHARLGCGLPGCQQLPRLPLRLRRRQEVRRPHPRPRRGRRRRATRASDPSRPHRRLHHGQQPDQGQRPGRRSSPTVAPPPPSRPTSQRRAITSIRRHRARGPARLDARPAIGTRWCSCRTPSPSACTAATRPTARRCASASRSRSRCTATVGDTGLDPQPALATGCTPNDDLTVWTCTLRDGVTFHDGSDLDASDVVMSFAAQWDACSPLHVGSHRRPSSTGPRCSAAASSTRPPVRPPDSACLRSKARLRAKWRDLSPRGAPKGRRRAGRRPFDTLRA